MKKSPIAIAAAALLGLGWLLLNHFDTVGEWLPVGGTTHQAGARGASTPRSAGDTIRVATFNIQVFGQSKLDKPRVMRVLAQVVRRFDVVAIQEVRSARQDVLPRFVEIINAEGRHYRHLISERLGRTDSKEQYAFVFDTDRIEFDEGFSYLVKDPGDRLHREPMVASFRVRGPPRDEAFTFKLVNIHTDPGEVNPSRHDSELNALDDVLRRVQNDGQGEDDVILLGDLNTHAKRLGELGALPGITAVLHYKVMTNTRQTRQYDNILFHRQATREFTGAAGVLNLMKEFGLTQNEALEVSDHLPVWAEFSIYEGGQTPGVIAGQPATRR